MSCLAHGFKSQLLVASKGLIKMSHFSQMIVSAFSRQIVLPAYEKTTGDPVVFLFIINLERVNSFEILFLVFAVPKLRGDNSVRRSYSCVRA